MHPVQDRRRLQHLHHERRLARRQDLVRRADAREDAVHQRDARARAGTKQPQWRQQHDERRLPQVASTCPAMFGPVMTISNRCSPPRRQSLATNDEPSRASTTGWRPPRDVELDALVQLRAHVAALVRPSRPAPASASSVRERRGGAAERARTAPASAAARRTAAARARRALLGAEHLVFAHLQLRRDVTLGVGDRLLARVAPAEPRLVRVRDLDVVTEHAVEADLERRDARSAPVSDRSRLATHCGRAARSTTPSSSAE